MEQKILQFALDFSQEGEARTGGAQGTQSPAARFESRTLAQSLMEAVVSPWNMRRALKRVRAKKGSGGVDGMSVDDLPAFLGEHWPGIRAALLDGSYAPQAVRRVEIPKPDGGVRQADAEADSPLSGGRCDLRWRGDDAGGGYSSRRRAFCAACKHPFG